MAYNTSTDMQRFIPRFLRGSVGISAVTTIGFVALLLLPEFAHAAFGTLIPPACNCDQAGGYTANGVTTPTSAPAWGCILATFQNAMTMAVELATVLISIFIALAGFTYMTSGGSAEKRQLANKRLMNAVIGLLIVLGAYLLVDSLMKVIYHQGATDGTSTFGPWNSILGTAADTNTQCLAPTKPPQALPALTGALAGTNGGGGSGSASTQTSAVSAGNGVCPVQSSGPCSASNFSGFGNVANTFSQICFNESANGALLQSTVDIGTDGQAVSFGLFQINISANPIGSLNCQAPNAFNAVYTSSNHNVHVTNQSLYNQCKAAALDPNQNIAEAQALYQAHGLSPWLADERKCGLSLLNGFNFLALAECEISG